LAGVNSGIDIMDPAALALALVSAQQGQFQAAVATKILKSSATQDAQVLQLLNAGNPLANVASGIGQNLDVSV
jgi:hypothetical protein